MNTKTKIIYSTFFLFSFLCAIILFSCDLKDPTEGLQVRVKNIARTTTVRVEFIDSKTGKVIGSDVPYTINILFEGSNKTDIITTVNEPITTLSTNDGFVNFAIRDNISPSQNNPIEVLLVCKSDKYLSTSQRLLIASPGTHGFTITMVNLTQNQQADGIDTKEEKKGTSSSTTGTNQDIVVTSSDVTSESKATIKIPAGTILKDSKGNDLNGDVTTRITYFNPQSEQALTSFPGGFDVNTDGQGRGSFSTAGFVAIDISVNGNSVESFSGQNVNIQIDVPAGTYNPTTKTSVKPGDVIPLYSYDESNGQWKYDGDYIVKAQPNRSSKIGITIENLKHLSYWNLDWFSQGYCPTGKTIRIDGCFTSVFAVVYYVSAQGMENWAKSGWITASDPYMTFTYSNPTIKGRIKIFETSNYQNVTPLGVLNLDSFCGSETVSFPIVTSSGDSQVDVYVRGICPNGNVLDEGTLDVEIFKNGSWQLAGRVVDGYIKLCLVINQEYTFRVYYDGQYYEQKHTAHGSSEHVDITLGNDIDLCR